MIVDKKLKIGKQNDISITYWKISDGYIHHLLENKHKSKLNTRKAQKVARKKGLQLLYKSRFICYFPCFFIINKYPNIQSLVTMSHNLYIV